MEKNRKPKFWDMLCLLGYLHRTWVSLTFFEFHAVVVDKIFIDLPALRLITWLSQIK